MKNSADPQNSPVFKAIDIAVRAHNGQYRKGTRVPYICHPLNAARILAVHGYDEGLVAAAVLHDVLEDSTCSIQSLLEQFGSRIAGIVLILSNCMDAPTWMEKKKQTIIRLASADNDALRVALSDKLSNLIDIENDCSLVGDAVWERFNGSRDELAWYYGELLNLFSSRFSEYPEMQLLSDMDEIIGKIFRRNPVDGPDDRFNR